MQQATVVSTQCMHVYVDLPPSSPPGEQAVQLRLLGQDCARLQPGQACPEVLCLLRAVSCHTHNLELSQVCQVGQAACVSSLGAALK